MKIGKTQSAYICKNCDGQCEGCIFEAEKEPDKEKEISEEKEQENES